MLSFKSLGSRHSLTFVLPSGVWVTLHTIQFTPVGWLCHLCDDVFFYHVVEFLFVDWHWSGRVDNGFRVINKLCVVRFARESADLSKQSLYSFRTWDLVNLPCWAACSIFGGTFLVVSFWMLAVIIPNSWACWQPIMEGWPGASTILKVAGMDLSLNVAFRVVVPRLSMWFPP